MLNPIVSILVVSIDYRLEYHIDKRNSLLIPKPEIRIYGSNTTGQRICCHIANVLPYIYIRPVSLNHAFFQKKHTIDKLLSKIETCLETILNNKNIKSNKKRKHVDKLEVVQKKSIYGMYLDDFFFIKVHLYHPRDKFHIADSLEDTPVLGIIMQCYEAHIPYLLQFTSDYNISPMGWLHLNKAEIRAGSSQFVFPDTRKDLSHATTSISFPDQQQVLSTAPSSSVKSTQQKSNAFLEPHDFLTQHRSQVYFSNSQASNSIVAYANSSDQASPLNPAIVTNLIPLSSNINQDEIDALLEGITAEHLIWTPPVLQQQPIISFDTAINPSEYNNSKIKISSCEIELDAVACDILNGFTPKQAFGSELWEEEKIRCLMKGISFEVEPSPPSTQTVHRHIYQTELDYLNRFKNLQKKGRALQIECNRKIGITTESNQDLVDCLSQYCRSDKQQNDEEDVELLMMTTDTIATEISKDLNLKIAEKTDNYFQDCDIDQIGDWVTQRVQEVEAQMHQELELVKDFNDELSCFHLNDDAIERENQFKTSKMPTTAFSNIHDIDEDEQMTANEISQEMENILWSTQINFENMHDEVNIASPAIAGINSPLFEMQRLDTEPGSNPNDSNILECSLANREELLRSIYSGYTPIKDDVPTTIQDNPSILETINNTQINSSSYSTSQKPLSSIFRKRKSKISPLAIIPFPVYKDDNFNNNLIESKYLNNLVELNDGNNNTQTKKTRRQVSFKGNADEIFELSPLKPAVSFLQSFISNTNDFTTGPPRSYHIMEATAKPTNINDETLRNGENVEGIINVSILKADSNVCLDIPVPTVNSNVCVDEDNPVSKAKISFLYLFPTFPSPSSKELSPLSNFGLEEISHQKLYYSDMQDTITSSSYSNQLSKINKIFHPIKMRKDCLPFDGGFTGSSPNTKKADALYLKKTRCLVPTFRPPSKLSIDVNAVEKWYDKSLKSQICTPTQTPNFIENSTNNVRVISNTNNYMNRLIVLSTEVFCCTRSNLLPNPKFDEVQMIIWIADDSINNSESESKQRISGVICCSKVFLNNRIRGCRSILLSSSGLPSDTCFDIVENEEELIRKYIHRVRTIDPDFLLGYELTSHSLGYLSKRSKVLGINLCQEISRMPRDEEYLHETENNEEDEVHYDVRVTGRIILNGWELMRDEVKLFNYTYSNVAAHVLSIRVPVFTFSQLTRWFCNPQTIHRVLKHIFVLTQLNLDLIDKIDLLRRVSECARLYGIDFSSVLTRGSQYRVEAALLVKAHSNGYLLISPSKKKVASQAPMEVIPLVMEPKSCIYTDPIVVLDFQSLYPSMILAYNLCFSTCMGKLKSGVSGSIDTTEKLGVVSYPEINTALNINLQSERSPYISPNGSIFCNKDVRLGILPEMVKEMLSTRVMVKKAMKKHTKDGHNKVLGKVLDARQLAIKLLSNVTYGYTAAGFSGRMPMAELADAIVQSGRSLLEWTISTINLNTEWNAEVVYGDTDSVFIHLPGRSVAQAFVIGKKISQYITEKSPANVVLKFEKVYNPSILVSKKRYVGYMFETIDQKIPHFEAKGIEVVRRDQCLATVKIQEKALRTLFDTRDMSKVRQYLESEWNKMMQGGDKLILKDFIFSKEVRFGKYSSLSSQPPGAIVATKSVLKDEMAVPPHNWRVPYVVVNGTVSSALKNLVYAPEELLKRGSALRLNYVYYMTKCINPALDRVLSLCGADIFIWFKNLVRPKLRIRHLSYDSYSINTTKQSSLSDNSSSVINKPIMKQIQKSMDQFTIQGDCEICSKDAVPQTSLCKSCLSEKNTSLIILMQRLKIVMNKEKEMSRICQNCSKFLQNSVLYKKNEIIGPDACESLDCMILYERSRVVTRIEDYRLAISEIEDIPHF